MSAFEWFLLGWMAGALTFAGVLMVMFRRKIGRWLP